MSYEEKSLYKEYDFCNEGSLIQKDWNSFGEKEVPNVKITLYNSEHKEIGSFFNDSVVSFYEEITGPLDNKMIIVFALLSPKILNLLRQYAYTYQVETEEIWRNSKTGKDQFFMGPVRIYHHIKLSYQTSADGDPACWYLILYNEKKELPVKKVKNLAEIKI